MHSLGSRAARIALAALTSAGAAQAQDVHKCTIDGQVRYQAQPCPSGDVVLQAAPTPSDQEQRQAGVDLSRQRWQAATGRLLRPAYVPPPPPPSPPPVVVPATTTSTTVIVSSSGSRGTLIVHQTTRTAGQSLYPAYQKPLNNCEKLNRDNSELLDRRDQLRAPGELASRQQMLDKAEADLAHVREMATASNCRLAR